MTEKKNYPPIHLGSPGEDISKKDLHAIAQRFKNLNQLRLQRIQDFLQARQQVFLQLLALLFHQNHPLLPGFISSETSAGIPDYKPNKQAILAAKQFSKGFVFKRRALLSYPIQGIFLMGSVGSIAFSKSSDMDIWLCHEPGLSSFDLDELQQKAAAIEKWAASYDLEVHFFLVNSEEFSKGKDIPISLESSGNTQHYLLLEEFYRTAIYIAGRIPAWWLVPPHQEQNYTSYIKHLIEHRFIFRYDVIDFGGLESIPAEEFISATLWHIYKSINSPHKSLLKLFLMESYASEFPQPDWLCFELKNAIYQGTFDIDQLDPYLLIYSKVEKYLQEAESINRLNLSRQCFYLKIMGSSRNELDYKSRMFREEYMQSIAKQWNWPEDLLPTLNKQKYWDIKKATKEHIIIRSELKHCLRMIMSLAGDYVNYNYRDNNDLKLISRKLHVFLERKPTKIEIITTRSTVHTKENELSIIETNSTKATSSWALFSGKPKLQTSSVHGSIKQEHSLISLLGWLVINGLYKKQLQLHFESSSLDISKSELRQLLDQLFKFLSQNLNTDSSPLTVYNKPNKLLSSLIVVNLGTSPVDERDDGLVLMSELSDPLSYSKNRHSFIQQIDQISISSWGEVTTSQFLGLDGFFSCLANTFNSSQSPVSSIMLKTMCFTPIRAKSITLRVESIFNNLVEFFSDQSNSLNYRYFLPAKYSYTIFQKKNKRLHYWPLESSEQLMQELANTQDSFSTLHFDPQVLENTLIPYLYSLNRKNVIQIFYYPDSSAVAIYIIDEKGSLYTQEHEHSNYDQVLSNYSIFLESVLNHPFYKDEVQLKFYEIQKNSAGVFSSHLIKHIPNPGNMDLPLRIIIGSPQSKTQSATYTVYCNEIEFSSADYGDNLFVEISKYILDFRQNIDNYPIHISDIDAPCCYLGVEDDSRLQTIHFLIIKKKIENKLNI